MTGGETGYRDAPAALAPDRSVLVAVVGHRIHGLDRTTGEVRWVRQLVANALEPLFVAIGYGVVMASSWYGKLYCLSYTTGATLWERETSAKGITTIVLEPEQIVVNLEGVIQSRPRLFRAQRDAACSNSCAPLMYRPDVVGFTLTIFGRGRGLGMRAHLDKKIEPVRSSVAEY